MQNPNTDVSGPVQVAGLVMHYIEVEAQSSSDYRIIEIELTLSNPNASASLVILRQDNYTNNTAQTTPTTRTIAPTTATTASTTGTTFTRVCVATVVFTALMK